MEGNDDKSDKRKDEHQQTCHLPVDLIIQHILPCLCIKALTRFKLISKEWYSIISSPKFILNYFKRSLFSDLTVSSPTESLIIKSANSFYIYNDSNHEIASNTEEKFIRLNVNFYGVSINNLRLVGSCNGLVCLANLSGTYFILWNPEINKFHKYNSPVQVRSNCNWGFGYVPITDDYKVVRVSHPCNTEEFSTVHVFSRKSNRWKEIEFGIDEEGWLINHPRLVNETLYWVKFHHSGIRIVGFDFVLETFSELSCMGQVSSRGLYVIGGCLVMVVSSSNSRKLGNRLVLHVVKRPGQVVSVCVPCNKRHVHDMIGLTKSGKILGALQSGYETILCLLDPLSKEKLDAPKFKGPIRIERYVPSEISPLPLPQFPNLEDNVQPADLLELG